MTKQNLDFYKKLWPCLSGKEISHLPEFIHLIQELRSLISAPATVYAELYEQTLWRFMEYAQALPRDISSPEAYSLLKTALETAIHALKRRRGKMMPPQSHSETIAEQEPLWTYALFTASLFAVFPDFQCDRTIELYKSEQEKIGVWHPVTGCLYEPKSYYKVLSSPSPVPVNSVFLLGALIGKILPTIACCWLTKNSTIWQNWWEVITKTNNKSNILWQLIGKDIGKLRA